MAGEGKEWEKCGKGKAGAPFWGLEISDTGGGGRGSPSTKTTKGRERKGGKGSNCH